jgi:hypothetical protein
LVTGLVTYPISETLENQLVGLEVVTVVLVTPSCLVAGLMALRNRPEAALLGVAPAAYTAYMFVQYVLGPEYAEYRTVALFHLALVTLSTGLSLWGFSLSRAISWTPLTDRQRRWFAVVLFAMAGFTAMRYLTGILGSFGDSPIPAEFEAARTFYWSIYLLDLGVVVPCAVVAAVALLRGTGLGRRGLYAVTGWFALVPPSVATMAFVMLVEDDPNASAASVAILSVAATLFAALAVAIYRTLFTGVDR